MTPGDRATACIIGGGSSGIAAAKALQDHRVSFDWYEAGRGPGGMWRYDLRTGPSPAYASLRTNTCRDLMAFSDLPFPAHLPDYLQWRDVAAYLDRYVERHRLLARLTPCATVTAVRLRPDGRYAVAVEAGEARTPAVGIYDSVVVASGPYHAAKPAHLPAGLDLPQVSSMDYHEPGPFAGRKVLVVGMGNSGVDIACDLAGVAARVVLSGRGPVTVIPDSLLGVPHDKLIGPLLARLPRRLQEALLAPLYFLARGSLRRHRVPKLPRADPSRRPRAAYRRVIASSDLLEHARAGRVAIRPEVVGGSGTRCRFHDGSSERFDAVVSAAGYTTELPFLSGALRRAPLGRYKAVVAVDFPGLYFIGLVCPRGPVMPLAELQSRWVAELHAGCARLPELRTMRRGVAARPCDDGAGRPTADKVDFHPYTRALRAELRSPATVRHKGLTRKTRNRYPSTIPNGCDDESSAGGGSGRLTNVR